MEKMTVEDFLKRARDLRALADAAEKDFFLFLYEGDKLSIHKTTACASFNEFLKRNNVCDVVRYESFKRTFEAVGRKEIDRVGVHAVVAAGSKKLKTSKERQEVLSEARDVERTNETSISKQNAERVARDVVQRYAVVRTRHKTYPNLAEENERLKARIAVLEAENATLRAKVRKLSGKTDKRQTKKAA